MRAVIALLLASMTVSSCSTTTRGLTLINQCSTSVLAGFVGGSIAQPVNGVCPEGTVLNPAGGCHWSLPAPVSGGKVVPGGVLLAPNTQAEFLVGSTPITNSGGQVIALDGTFYASTGCDGSGANCQTAWCNDGTKIVACSPYVGPQGPTTIAEVTMLAYGVDNYDVSMVNGMNVPMSFGPAIAEPQGTLGPYFCQTAGSLNASTGSPVLPACTWTFTPPATGPTLPLVTAGGAACTSNSNCSNGQVCGYAPNIGFTTVTQGCGTQLGWWNADELCDYTNNTFKGGGFNCAQTLSTGTVGQLAQCNGSYNNESCYTIPTVPCCGCESWTFNGVMMPGAQCPDTNSDWTSRILPYAKMFKDACPTVYSYVYDDPTSSFTCQTPNVSSTTPNTMGYVVTFCPNATQNKAPTGF